MKTVDCRLSGLLKTKFGFDQFLPMQEEIVRHVLTGKDALVLMPTGGGKSLCYQLPALVFDGVTLVISPLIALMKDQVDGLKANGVPAECVNSSLKGEEIYRIKSDLRAGRVKLLYVAPERLATEGFRNFLKTLEISAIAVDEAHCISQWGHDFRPDYLNLNVLREDFHSVGVLALTATATPRVRQDIIKYLPLKKPHIFLSSFDRPNLHYDIRPRNNAFEELIALLQDSRYRDRSVIVYCYSRKDTEELAYDLCRRGFKAEAYHAGLDAKDRHDIQDRFIRDETPIITATIAFGMGVDKPDIRLVVHYALPGSVEGYYQETGRAGRDGLSALCVLFYSYSDKFKQDYFIDQIEDEAERERATLKLKKIISFCEIFTCRRRFLLDYFGERYTKNNCRACDRCLVPIEEFDADEIGRTLMRCVKATGGRFGAQYIVDILRGSRNQRVCQYGHDRLPGHGQGRMFSAPQLREMIELIIQKGLLVKDDGEYPVVGMTEAGLHFLESKERLMLPQLRSSAKKSRKAQDRDAGAASIDTNLFEELRVLRKFLADQRGVPPFVIFGDVSLKEMARRLPQDEDAFLAISGVGEQKLKWFGPVFMKKIREHCSRQGISPVGEVASAQVVLKPKAVIPGETYQETRKLMEKKHSIEEMVNIRGLTRATILTHVERLANEDPDLDIGHLKPRESDFSRINLAFEKSQAGLHALSPVKAILGEEYSYDEIRLVRIFLAREQLKKGGGVGE